MSSDANLIIAGDEAAGSRLDSFLAATLGEISRTKIRRAIENGDVLVNDRVVKASYHLRPGDKIDADLPEPPPVELLAEPIPVKICFEDEDIIVVEKPAGMVVHPGAGIETGTLANALVYHFNRLSGIAGAVRPGIVHRLDKETSGLLVVAKNDIAHEILSDQFRDREVFKLYAALVHGGLARDHGEINERVGRSGGNRTRMAVLRGGAGRPALTVYDVVERFKEFTLAQVQIKTGRTHQIRVHMAHIGHPVVGDSTYGSERSKAAGGPAVRRQIAALGRHFLHSSKLAFRHPRTGEHLEFSSALPVELAALLSQLDK